MFGLTCFWYRPHLEALATGRLEGRPARWVAGHVAGCERCRRTAEAFGRLRGLVRAAALPPGDPDWSTFWPAVRTRIETEAPRPLRESWWLPLWKPVWGHPRLATFGAMAAALLATVTLWPVSQDITTALTSPVVVQDVAISDPGGSVMVYSNKDSDVTVIWMFAADTAASSDD